MTDSESQSPRFSPWLLRLGLCFLVAVVLMAVTVVMRGRSSASTAGRPIEMLTEDFVSSDSCRECHRQEYQSWHASYHRTMTQVVDSETAPEAIRNQEVTVAGEPYTFEQQGDQFFVTFADPIARGQTRRRQIELMTGSHHMHVFWYRSHLKRSPGMLPVVYLKDQQRWIRRESSFLRPPVVPMRDEMGRWNETCCACHSTRPRPRHDPDTGDWDTHVVEFGIACEACHGQGAQHIQRHRNEDEQEDAVAADPIINPESVAKEVSADVCGQCHSIAGNKAGAWEEFLQDGHPFRPGSLLADSKYREVIQAGPNRPDTETQRNFSQKRNMSGYFWPDGMVRVSGREYNGLIESPCYQHGDMTCLSCHTMHSHNGQSLTQWRDDQLKPQMRGDQACLQCHAELGDDIAAHTHHAADSAGSRCLNCHMPYTTYGLLKTIRSHQISSPSAAVSRDAGRASACNLCHLDRSLGWTALHLTQWYGHGEEEFTDNDKNLSTALLQMLTGDAAQRAVQASALGWKPAQEASGTEWMQPLLLQGMDDPYDAVRIIATRSYQTLPGNESFDYDPLGDWQDRHAVIEAELDRLEQNAALPPRPELLIDSSGTFDRKRAKEMMRDRDNRHIILQE